MIIFSHKENNYLLIYCIYLPMFSLLFVLCDIWINNDHSNIVYYDSVIIYYCNSIDYQIVYNKLGSPQTFFKDYFLTLSPMGGASEAPPQHFCDCSGTVIARTLKFFTFRKAKLNKCYKTNFFEFLFVTPLRAP